MNRATRQLWQHNRLVKSSVQQLQYSTSARAGLWTNLEEVGLDAIKQLTIRFQQDSHVAAGKQKVLLGEGVYRDDNGRPVILKSVREAERRLFERHLDHEYAPVPGLAAFCEQSRLFAFGNSQAVRDARIATVQTLSGTGALRLAAEFLRKFTPNSTAVFFPAPTWVNHPNIFKAAGLSDIRSYRYYNAQTNGMDTNGCLEDLKKAPKRSIVVLHACAHNPTGVDPTMQTWKQISQVCKERDHIVLFDNAYQGFASGDWKNDASAFRYFVNEEGHLPLVCQSYAKNFGMYGERVGALNIVCETRTEANAVHSQLQTLIRSSYSNPPIYGARIVSTILADPELKKQWEGDVLEMASRIRHMREGLVYRIVNAGSKKHWNHITDQIGMFAYSGLNAQQVNKLISEYHVYMTNDGRMSIAGLNTKNIDYVAEAIHQVTKD